MLILAALTRKNKFCQGFARGSSSIFSPNNFLDQTQQKGLVMAVYGLVFSKLAMLVIAPDPLPFSKDTPVEIKEYMKIVAIFYYPVLYYPLLVCGTLQLKTGYVFGTALSFTHFGVLVWQKFDCPKSPEQEYNECTHSLILPQMTNIHCTCAQCDSFAVFMYWSSSTEKPTLAERILEVLKSYIYVPEKGEFLVKPLCFTLQTALLLVVLVVPTLHIVRAGIDENIAFLLMGFGIVLSEDRMEVVKIVTFYTWLLEVCYLCAVTLSCLVSLVMIMKSMVLHRSNLKGLYKGDVYNLYNSPKTISPSKPGVVCWMGLTGYQAAITCLGLGIQTVVFFICFLFLVFLMIIPVVYGHNLIAFKIAGKAWPVWVTLTLATVLQHLTAKFAFIKKESGTRDLNNRESLYLLTYLLFLINTVVGQIVAIWRMVITALYNIIHFGRIDISLLHRTAESYDPAYRYYTHFLKVEVSQSHPVMKAFCGVLLDIMMEGGSAGQKIRDAEEGIQNSVSKAAKSRRLRSRWQLLYTLVNNPSLLGSRKHFQTRQTADSALNGTPNHSFKKGSKTEHKKEKTVISIILFKLY
uniref:Receptor for retinol uptake STRA6 n=1 Tax=Anabas testudineus TaxID=64144 RepID=A0A3Q1KBR9_ANATE